MFYFCNWDKKSDNRRCNNRRSSSLNDGKILAVSSVNASNDRTHAVGERLDSGSRRSWDFANFEGVPLSPPRFLSVDFGKLNDTRRYFDDESGVPCRLALLPLLLLLGFFKIDEGDPMAADVLVCLNGVSSALRFNR